MVAHHFNTYLLALAAAFCFLLPGCPATPPSTEPSFTWAGGYEEALTLAQSSSKPVFLYIHLTDCPSCEKMNTRVFPLNEVGAEAANWIMARADANERPDLVAKYGIKRVPHIFLLDPDGVILSQHEGPLTSNELVDMMRGSMQKS